MCLNEVETSQRVRLARTQTVLRTQVASVTCSHESVNSPFQSITYSRVNPFFLNVNIHIK